MQATFYLALGDSITAGYGAGRFNSFAAIYARFLTSRLPGLQFKNLGVSGLTTSALASQLISNPAVRRLISDASLITLTIGSADLLLTGKKTLAGSAIDITQALGLVCRNLEVIGTQLRLLNPAAKVEVAAVYNPLPGGPFASYSSQAQALINQANSILANWSVRFGFVLVPVDRAFAGREPMLTGPDHAHPNPAGHKLIAELFFKTACFQ